MEKIPDIDDKDYYYTIEEVATLLRVSVRTVYRWIKAGRLEAVQVMGSGAYRIPIGELERALAGEPMQYDQSQ